MIFHILAAIAAECGYAILFGFLPRHIPIAAATRSNYCRDASNYCCGTSNCRRDAPNYCRDAL